MSRRRTPTTTPRIRRPISRGRRRLRPEAEAMEARTLLSLLFQPALQGETPKQDGGARSGDNPVYLIFSGTDWQANSDAMASPYIAAAEELITPAYLAGISQYGIGDHAYYAGSVFDSRTLGNGFDDNQLNDVINDEIGHGLPEPDDVNPTPIYVVVTDPGVRSNEKGAFGYNERQKTGSILDLDEALEIWDNGDSVDGFSKTLSHELAETMTDPGVGGYEVNPGPGWKASTSNASQIGDYEGGVYAYRMQQGVMAQPIWSNAPAGWLGSDGTGSLVDSQIFNVTPDPNGWVFNSGGFTFDDKFAITINGDQLAGKDDDITITTDSLGNPQVTMNGETQNFDLYYRYGNQQFQPGQITGITINTGAGDDRVDVENLDSSIPLTINLGSGADTVDIGDASDDIGDHVQGPVMINSAGTYSLTLSDYRGTLPTGAVSVSSLGVAGIENGQVFGYDQARLTDLELQLPGSPTVDVYGTPSGPAGQPATTTIDTTTGGSATVHGNGAKLSVGGPTRLEVDGNSGTITGALGVRSGPLTGEQADILSNTGNITLFANSGGATYNIDQNHGNVTMTGGIGYNAYNLHWDAPGGLSGLGGHEQINAPPVNNTIPRGDTLEVYDDNNYDLTSTSYTVTGSSIVRQGIEVLGSSVITHTDSVTFPSLTGVTLHAGRGGSGQFNFVDIKDTSSPTTVWGGPGTNIFTVEHTGASTSIGAEGLNDPITIQRIGAPTWISDDSQSGAAITATFTGNAIVAPVTVVGKTGKASLTVNDAGISPTDSTPTNLAPITSITLAANTLTRTGFNVPTATIHYYGVSNLTVNPGQIFPTFVSISGTSPTTTTTISAGPATVLVAVGGGNLSGVQGSLAVHGPTNLRLDDSADNAARAATLAADTLASGPYELTGLAPAPNFGDNRLASLTMLFGAQKTLTVHDLPPVPVVVAGGGSADTLRGPDQSNSWVINGVGAGALDGKLSFQGLTSLVGGSGADSFQITAAAKGPSNGGLSGSLDGGGGTNTLSYAGYNGSVVVDLPLGIASAVAGGIAHFRNARGGATGNDILVGDGTGNLLRGGGGRNLLIAGSGAGTLSGGPDSDVLIGGATPFDKNVAALDAVLAEWGRTDESYSARVAHLLGGGGLNGSDALNAADIAYNPGGNTLDGNAGADLFYGRSTSDGPKPDVTDWNASQGEVFVGPGGEHVGVQIDVLGLTTPQITLDGALNLPANAATWEPLQPGTHELFAAGYGVNVFTVTAAGTIGYASALQGAFTGAGTNTLVVHGEAVTIDATALSAFAPKVVLDGVVVATATPIHATLLPGNQFIQAASGYGAVGFSIDDSGHVGYVSALQGVLAGAGTGQLAVHGAAVTVDATAVSAVASKVVLDGVVVSAATPITAALLPGTHVIEANTGYGTVAFTVDDAGHVGYTASPQVILAGAGTSRLVVQGAPVTFDARALAAKTAWVYVDGVKESSASPFGLRLLSGTHVIEDAAGDAVLFTVDPDGTIDYAATYNSKLSGRGTKTLTILSLT